ncbi:MAG: lipocalin family protein [Bacteroidales bacterium]|nr:lipocalin family protein [Bacteroidales bacterium]
MLRFQTLIAVMLCVLMGVSFTSCGDDDEDEPKSSYATAIIGTWKVTQASSNNSTYIDWPYATTTATFKADGTYSGSGYFGNGSGTYKLVGSKLTTYVDGSSYLIYDIIDLSGSTATLKITMDGSDSSIYVKATKQ